MNGVVAAPRERRLRVNGIGLCCFEHGTRSDTAPTALFAHATGFHARCYDRAIAAFGGHAIAVELRGHGRSDKTPPYTWNAFRDDVVALIDALDLDRLIGVGHSMGGHCMVQTAAVRRDRFERLVLIDPVILAPDAYAAFIGDWQGARNAAEHPTAKRRNAFGSAEEMFDRFADRLPFSGWQPEVLRDYCTFGLLPAPEGDGFVLACPPIVEASVYMGSASRDPYDLIPTLPMPVTVMRGRERTGARGDTPDFSSSPTWPGLAARFSAGRDVYLPHLTHFIPMEAPELVGDYVAGRR